MEDFIRRYFSFEYEAKSGHDIILNDIFKEELQIAHMIKIVQMKLGQLYEVLAEKYFGFTRVKKIDLIHTQRKVALELKSSDNTDNSSSRYRNLEKLLEFKKDNPDYMLYYVCINNTTKTPQKKVFDNGIKFLTGKYALEFLYGKDYEKIIKMIMKVLKEQRQHLQIAGTPSKASSTTSVEKPSEGTQLIADPNGKNEEDMEAIRSQAPKSAIGKDMEKVQRADGGGLEGSNQS